MLHSIVEYYAEHESYRCGYCRSPDTNCSHGLWAHALTVADYQDLIDRGWRRSGKYCYKPTMDVTCCPMYTIRCRALEFKVSKSQKKVFKRFNKHLAGEEENGMGGEGDRKMSSSSCSETPALYEGGMEQFVEANKEHQDINLAAFEKAVNEKEDLNEANSIDKSGCSSRMDIQSSCSNLSDTKKKEQNKVAGPDPEKGPCKKAKQLRRERKLEKLKMKGIDISDTSALFKPKNKEKQVEDFINELPKEFQERLEIKLVRTAPPSPEFLETFKETHEVYLKYQVTIHDDKPEKCTESKFKDFLVQSPLLEEHTRNSPPCGYGSFHQQYWLCGKLIAVGVIDILPKCVSSVYFFYDPQFTNLTLGTYGALREIAFTRDMHILSPDIQYYYMGYYIHSCHKMRYKGNFHPSDLLCPETFKWFPIKDCIPKLEASKYARLDPDIDSVDTNYPKDEDLNYIPVWLKGAIMPYKVYKRKYASRKKECSEELIEYARLVGAKTAKSLVLVR